VGGSEFCLQQCVWVGLWAYGFAERERKAKQRENGILFAALWEG